MVGVVDRYGLVEDVPDEVAASIVAEGGRYQTPEELAAQIEAAKYSALPQQAAGAAEAVARGASLGLSDVALRELAGDDWAAEARARQESLGAAGTALEVGGAVLPAFVSGGGSAAGSVGRLGLRALSAPARGVAGLGRAAEVGVGGVLRGGLGLGRGGSLGAGLVRGAELAAGGMTEGALYGAGHALSEEALSGGNYNQIGEKLWAGASEGMWLGGITGGALGFMGGAGTRAIQRGLGKLEGAEGLHRIVQKFGDQQTLRALGGTSADVHRMGRSLRSREEALATMASDVRSAELRDGTKVFKAGDNAEALAEKVGRAQREVGEDLGNFRKTVDDFVEGQRPDLRINKREFMDQIDDISAKLRQGNIPELVERANKIEATFAQFKGGADKTVGLGELTSWRGRLDDVLYPQRAGGLRSGGLPAPPPVHKAELEQARMVLENTIEAATERAVAQMSPASAGTYRTLKGKYRSLKQAKDIAEGAVNRELGGRMFKLSDMIAGAAGVATGGIGGVASGVAIGAANKLFRERGSSVLAVMADRLAKVDGKIDKSLRGFFRRGQDARRGLTAEVPAHAYGTDKALERKRNESRVDAYNRLVAGLQRFQADPVAGMERKLGPAMAATAPRAAMAMTAAATRANQFLLAKLPVVPTQDYPGSPPPEPAPAELAKYARYVQAVRDPLSVLDELSAGTLAPEHAEGLRAVYPDMYEDIRQKAYAEFMDRKSPPPVAQRLQLGILMELPTDKMLRPTSIIASQSVYAPVEAAPATQPTGGKAPDISDAFSSRAQQLGGLENF